MSDGATISAPAAACDSADARQLFDRRVVDDLPVDEDAAVAVRRVLAEADVGDDEQIRHVLLERADGGLHRRFRIVGADPIVSFASGSPKSSTPGTPSAFAAAASFTTSSTDSW